MGDDTNYSITLPGMHYGYTFVREFTIEPTDSEEDAMRLMQILFNSVQRQWKKEKHLDQRPFVKISIRMDVPMNYQETTPEEVHRAIEQEKEDEGYF
jgi:hypothetical protein